MNPSSLRLIIVLGVLCLFSSTAGAAWEKGVKKITIPFGLSASQLPDPQSNGATLFASYCSQCHNLPSPRMHSTDDWPMRFEKMMDHAMLMAGTSSGVKLPADKEKGEIIAYLVRNGFKGLPADSPLRGEYQVFNIIWFCSVCHAVPDPSQYPAKEWAKIVDRMNGFRKKQGRDEMSNADRNAVINFLAKQPK